MTWMAENGGDICWRLTMFLPHNATQSVVMPQYVAVCPCVRYIQVPQVFVFMTPPYFSLILGVFPLH